MKKIAKLKNDSEIREAFDNSSLCFYQREFGETSFLKIDNQNLTVENCIDATCHGFEIFVSKCDSMIIGESEASEVSYEALLADGEKTEPELEQNEGMER